MKIGLFVPCYMDQFYPSVAIATLDLLESLGMEVAFPESQTCCGQPMANTGCADAARPVAERFVEIFAPYDAIVCPSGSCVSMVRHHYSDLVQDQRLSSVQAKTFELCEFLHDELKVPQVDIKFPFRVGLHQSCHGLRELRLGGSSEQNLQRSDKVRSLLEGIQGLEIVELDRPDECCGFGGTFAVNERAVSVAMGEDRIEDHLRNGVDVMIASDMSCLMHMNGLIRRQGRTLAVMHVAEVLAGRMPSVSVTKAV